jgi:glycerol uptake facilitator-like aquaporin
MQKKADGNWTYAWIPVVAPIAGGIFAALLHQYLS